VFVNPAAGGGRAAMLVPVMRDWLAAHAPQARLEVPGDAQAARALAAALPPATRCVLVGGDGTVHQLLPALLQGGHSMGLVPIGSGNDTARALGLHGLGWSQALQRALVAPARTIDVGELQLGAGTHAADGSGTRLFVSSLAAGFDAAVGLRALAGPGWLRGLPRYLWATFGELAALRCSRIRVEADGQLLHDGPSIFASVLNTPSYGRGMPAMPEARVDDARLDALVAGHFSRLGALRMLPRLLAGTHLGDARIRTRACTVLRVTSDEPWALAADGEPAGRARAWEVRVRPGALPAVAGAPQGTRQSRA
jgi:diacylglycerol kinase family enzyme